MRNHINKAEVLENNKIFHDDVESLVYDQRMNVTHHQASVEQTVNELERVYGNRLPSDQVIADLGAGTGNIAVKLAIDGRFKDVIAVDISEKMLAIAEQSAKENHVEIKTIVSTMEKLPFEDNELDLIVGCAFLHHLPDPAAFMKEVSRVLKEGGSCIIIGEPSEWGESLTNLLKLPLIGLLKLKRWFVPSDKPVWEHDLIDVHTFSNQDITNITRGLFKEVTFHNEGFLEPMIDQSWLTAISLVFGKIPGIRQLIKAIQYSLGFFDNKVFNYVLPTHLLFSVKFHCKK